MEYWNLVDDSRLHITLHLYTEQGVVAFTTGSAADADWRGRPLAAGLYRSVCQIPGNLLNSGKHRIELLVIGDLTRLVYRNEDVASFEVFDLSDRGEGWHGKEPGAVRPRLPGPTNTSVICPTGRGRWMAPENRHLLPVPSPIDGSLRNKPLRKCRDRSSRGDAELTSLGEFLGETADCEYSDAIRQTLTISR